MENAIKKIIEIEHKARDIVSQGYKQAEDIRLETLEVLKNMEKNIEESVNHKIEELKAKIRLETDEKIGKIRESAENRIRTLEEYARKNRDAWEDEIFSRIVGR